MQFGEWGGRMGSDMGLRLNSRGSEIQLGSIVTIGSCLTVFAVLRMLQADIRTEFV